MKTKVANEWHLTIVGESKLTVRMLNVSVLFMTRSVKRSCIPERKFSVIFALTLPVLAYFSANCSRVRHSLYGTSPRRHGVVSLGMTRKVVSDRVRETSAISRNSRYTSLISIFQFNDLLLFASHPAGHSSLYSTLL